MLDGAVALLDEAGAPALTFRALAGRLGTGVGTIYWYVSSKDELLDRATDHVLSDALATIEAMPEGQDPIEDLRTMAITLFEAIVDRPWLSGFFMRNTDLQGNSLRIYELLGEPTLRMDLTTRQRFHAASTIAGFVIGTAADLGQEPPEEVVEGRVSRDQFLGRYADAWRALDPADFPFVHEIADEFDGHDDVEQFRAGLDLILAGLRLQAGRRSS